MSNKYSIETVACFNAFDSKFFTYPNDKRKKTKVEIPIRFVNGSAAHSCIIFIVDS
jgi:hypothetical protein